GERGDRTGSRASQQRGARLPSRYGHHRNGMDMDNEEQATPTAAGDPLLEESMSWIRAREIAVARRARALAEREELLRVREAALEASSPTDDAGDRQGHLLGQVREANERLITAIMEAQELADQAHAARLAADHNEERFRSLVYTSSALVWQAGADGRIEIDRDAWRRFTGIDLGQGDWGWLEAVHPSDQDRVRDAWAAAVAQGGGGVRTRASIASRAATAGTPG
ncbi:MAG TPA: hypothetical protein VFK02_05005, partial [Kofleriaceae bacterium]|nr:hypothetical protein [Kofleriaceae bacterium]